MASPLTVKRNDYHKHKKASTIYTPVGVAQFLFDILHPQFSGCRIVFDPAIGTGRLTDPWALTGHRTIGCDFSAQWTDWTDRVRKRFEDFEWPSGWPKPDLVLCNPPFNGAEGKKLYPEVFLEHIFKLFGPKQSTAIFTPMGFRLNQRKKSKRFRWLRDCGAEITSIVSLPLDVFEKVEFHAEILIFNIFGLKAHYFLPEEALTV